jgi:hypothetical protein
VLRFATAVALILTVSSAFADPAPAKAPPIISPSFTVQEANIVYASLANAGAACDAGVKIYCQISVARDPVLGKLRAAAQSASQVKK